MNAAHALAVQPLRLGARRASPPDATRGVRR